MLLSWLFVQAWDLWCEVGYAIRQQLQALQDNRMLDTFIKQFYIISDFLMKESKSGAVGFVTLLRWLWTDADAALLFCCVSVILTAILFGLYCSTWKFRNGNGTGGQFQQSFAVDMDMFDLVKTAYLPGHLEAVVSVLPRWLRSHDINESLPQSGLTLLLCACLSGEKKLVEHLMQCGAYLNQVTLEGDSALYLATYGVLSSKQPWNTELLELIIATGCDVNHQNKRGYTALHRAAARGNIPVLEFLLRNGADAEVQTLSGVYPIDSATNAGHIDAAELLQVDVPDSNQVWEIVDPHTPAQVRLGLKSPRREHLAESFIGTKSIRKELLLNEL